MNAIKVILNVLGVLLAILVTLILTAWLICASVLASATAWVQPETLQEMVQNIDYSTLVKDFDYDEIMGEEMTPELEAIMKTDLMGNILKMYVEDLYAQIEGQPVGTICNAQTIRRTMQAHMKELLPILRSIIEQEAGQAVGPDTLSDAELEKMFLEVLDREMPGILQEMPTAESLGITDEVRVGLQVLRGDYLMPGVIVVAGVLSLLLFLLRAYRLRGFIWLSVVYFLNAGIGLVLSQSVTLVVEQLPAGTVAVITEIIAEMLAVMSGKLMTATAIYAVIAVVCVLAAVLYHNHLQHKKINMPMGY